MNNGIFDPVKQTAFSTSKQAPLSTPSTTAPHRSEVEEIYPLLGLNFS